MMVILNEKKISAIVNGVVNKIMLHENKEEALKELYAYLSKEATDDIYDGGKQLNTMYKAYNYFEPRGIVHDVWAVHFTDVTSFEGIMAQGFKYGVSNFDELAYSANYYDTRQKSAGWCFALPIDNSYIGQDLGYGDCAFLIKTDGVRAYHKGDNDEEIIFRGDMVKECIPFVYDEDYDCWILYDYDFDHYPKGAYWENELGRVVFGDIYSLIHFAINH